MSDIVQNVSQKGLIYHNLSVHNNIMNSFDDKIIYKHYFCKSSMRITHQAVLFKFFLDRDISLVALLKKEEFQVPTIYFVKKLLKS